MKTRRMFAAAGVALILVVLLAMAGRAQAADPSPVVGTWEGTLDPGAQAKKRIVVHIAAAQDGSLSGTIDYPDENASGALITAITFKEPTLHLECSSSLAVFDGALNPAKTEIMGSWKQGATPVTVTFKKTA